MLLTIDIGNTNITLGVFKSGKNNTFAEKPKKKWRLSTNKTETADEYGQKIMNLFHYGSIEAENVSHIAIASVVPALNYVFQEVSKDYFKKEAFFIEPCSAPLKLLCDNPNEVGADRIADAVAVYDLFGGPAIVIDFGTATTFDCIDKNGSYIGGAIAPGPLISAESLSTKTAQLPQVGIVKTKKSIGKSTIKSIQSGIYFGYIGLIKEILKRMIEEMSCKPLIIATGGLANLISKEISDVKQIVPDLTLEGIRISFQMRKL